LAVTERTAANPITLRHLARLAGLGAGLALAGATLIYLCWKVPHPIVLQYHQQGELAGLEAQLAQKRSENRQLKAQRDGLATPEGQRLEARKLSYVRPGERPIRFYTPPPPPPQPRTAPPPPPAWSGRLYLATRDRLAAAQRGLCRFVYGR